MKPNHSDPLESQLRELPLRTLPPQWRREIMAAAEAKNSGHFLLTWLPGRWTTGVMVTAWLIIAILRLNTPSLAPSTGPAISAQNYAQAQQERFLLIASLETRSSKEPEFPARTWTFPFEKRPL